MDNKKIVAYIIAIIMLMELVDGSALNTSLPQIASSFNVNPITLKVAITVYLLTLGLFIPASAWVADKIGMKKVLIISATGFVGSSILCGLSPNLGTLVIARAIQGFFGAFTMPVARLAMVRIFREDILYAMSIIALVISTGPMIGPVIGGGLTTFLSWRYIFFINVLIGIIVIPLIFRLFPNLTEPINKNKKFDLTGFLLIGTSITLYMLLLEIAVDYNISSIIKIMLLLIATSLGFCYIKYAKNRGKKALIDINIFHNIAFSRLILISIIFRLCIFGLMFLFPLYLQTKQGFSAFEAGLIFLTFILANLSMKKLVKRLKTIFGTKTLFTWILLQVISSYFIIAYELLYFNLYLFIMGLALLGTAFGVFATLSNASIYASVSDKEAGDCSVITSCVIQLTGAFAVAWVAIVLTGLSGANYLSASTKIPDFAFTSIILICILGMFLNLLLILKTSKQILNDINI